MDTPVKGRVQLDTHVPGHTLGLKAFNKLSRLKKHKCFLCIHPTLPKLIQTWKDKSGPGDQTINSKLNQVIGDGKP